MESPRENADVETSSDAYARRFEGAVGTWFLDVQAGTTLELLAPFPGARVLDVGGGHGQLAQALLGAGHELTIVGSAPECAHRVQPLVDAGRVRFQAADLLALPYPDRTFDVALAFRLLPHVARWRELIAELCRVAARAVIVDYPTQRSVNAVSGALFALKRGVEKDTRPFTVFRDAEVESAFAAAGFRTTARRGQFVAPMALHRAHGSATLGRMLENSAGAIGLRRLLGSPVIARAERHG
jgi:2-polyprenyl-3-methyl-5-hydroxy-6-metoxy-1,4-benzoquinol methylase